MRCFFCYNINIKFCKVNEGHKMRNGLVDIFTSRRDCFDECQFWKIDEDEYVDANELVYSTEPSGFFNAKQVTSEENSAQVVGGVFMFDSSNITLKTNDDIDEVLKKNYIVLFRNEIWRVENVQKAPIKKNYQFSNEISYTFYVRLKK